MNRPPYFWPFPIGDAADDEPTDAQLAAQGINTEPTDPHNNPSYQGWTP